MTDRESAPRGRDRLPSVVDGLDAGLREGYVRADTRPSVAPGGHGDADTDADTDTNQ